MKRLIAGVVVAAGVAVFAGVGAFGDETTRNGDGQITEGGGLGAFVIQNGDCINLPEESLIQSVEGVPCAAPHDAEAYLLFDLADGPFPGIDWVSEAAANRCVSAFHAFVGVAFERSELDVFYLHPTEESWNELDDREVVCMVTTMDGSQVTGSLGGSGR